LRTTPFDQYSTDIDLRTTPFGQYFLGIGLFQKVIKSRYKILKVRTTPFDQYFLGVGIKIIKVPNRVGVDQGFQGHRR
jgi:hypothetical protein